MACTRWMLLATLLVGAGVARADEPGGGTDPLAVPPASSREEDQGLRTGRAGSEPLRIPRRQAEERLPLSLAEAMAMSIENNLGVEIARHDPLIAWERTRIAWGAYDPVAETEVSVGGVETPIASALQAGNITEDETWRNRVGISGVLPALSTQYEIGFSGNRTKTDRSIATLREQWESALSFSIAQPLLRNLYWNEPWTEVKLSSQAYRQSLEDFRLALMDTIRGVEDAYWLLVASDDQERVAEKSLETARELLEQTDVQYEVGVVSRVEVVEAEAGVAAREVDLIRARNAYRSAQDVLIDRILGPKLSAGSQLEVEPTDRPDDYLRYDVDVPSASDRALARRPELAAFDRAIEQQEIALRFARNQMAPQLDLVASYGYQGLAGKPCDPTPTTAGGISFCPPGTSVLIGQRIDDSFRSSVEDFFDHDGAVSWSVGGVVSIPLGNHAPRARRRQAEIELRKVRTQRVRLVQDIILEIRQAARDLRTAQENIEAAERRRLAAEEQFRAESIRLEQGESTPFDVLERERDLVEAESQKIDAFQVYRRSVAALERAQGTILERHNIVVDEARRLR